MGRQKRRPKPSPPLKTQNWAGITPQRIKEVDQFAREAFLEPLVRIPNPFTRRGHYDYAPTCYCEESRGEP